MKRLPIAYAVATEHLSGGQLQLKRITDVTPRYAESMVESLKLRGIAPKQQAKVLADHKSDWWPRTLKVVNSTFKDPSKRSSQKSNQTKQTMGNCATDVIDVDDDAPIVIDDSDAEEGANSSDSDGEDHAEKLEKDELKQAIKSEALPSSKAKFKNHHLYVIPSVLKSTEVLAPDAKKRICGIFKGEVVYSRSDVSEAIAERKWLYKGRKVLEKEITKPVKRVKARAKSSSGASFKALKSYGVGKGNDGSIENENRQLEMASKPLEDKTHVDLFAVWQTEAWSPKYVGPNDPIPVNEYKNVELELLNPGLSHINEPRVASVAKKLGM